MIVGNVTVTYTSPSAGNRLLHLEPETRRSLSVDDGGAEHRTTSRTRRHRHERREYAAHHFGV
jgi:hypothetical protein